MKRVRRLVFRFLLIGTVLALFSPVAAASSQGGLRAFVSDGDGNPLANLLVSLRGMAEDALPFLSRTDDLGLLQFENLSPGTYQLEVKSAFYQSPANRSVEIEAGKTLGIRLVLDQLLTLGLSDQPNLGIKSLLRSTAHRRLILRTTAPGQSESDRGFFEKALFEVRADTGSGSSPFIHPGGASGGTSTNFGIKQSTGVGDYMVAGQINSGPDSVWRLKNFLNYELTDNHSLQFLVGYGQLSLNRPSLGMLEHPSDLGNDRNTLTAFGNTRILSLGIEDRWVFGDTLSLAWGVEFNQVRDANSRYYASPSAELDFSPAGGTHLRFLIASKRKTRSDTVRLPDEPEINLAEAVFVSVLDDRASIGQARYAEASVAQDLGENSQIEFAVFENRYRGATQPFLAALERASWEALQLEDGQARNQGYRVSYRRELSPNMRATVSYLRGTALGVDEQTVLVDPKVLAGLFKRQGFHAFSTQLEAFIPASGTHLTALVKAVPGGDPIASIDALSNVFDTANQGVNLFVRQLVPVPSSFLGLFDLDFLEGYKIEALFDLRNLTNENLARLQTADGYLTLVQYPRSVRGGISVNF